MNFFLLINILIFTDFSIATKLVYLADILLLLRKHSFGQDSF